MNFNRHSNLEGLHAFLSPSQHSWINYSEDKLIDAFANKIAVERGTKLHELAAKLIELGEKLPDRKKTLNMYVNDAIGYKMKPEQPLFYSIHCFGTADTISFRKEGGDKYVLRIHDLKTGRTKAHMSQLEIYAALFCLEYDINPKDIIFELRIYQYNRAVISNPTIETILPIMDKIVAFDNTLNNYIQSMEGDVA